MARELFRFGVGSKKNYEPKRKKSRATLFGKHAPESERLRHVFRKRWFADIPQRGGGEGVIPKGRIRFTPVVLSFDGEVLFEFG